MPIARLDLRVPRNEIEKNRIILYFSPPFFTGGNAVIFLQIKIRGDNKKRELIAH